MTQHPRAALPVPEYASPAAQKRFPLWDYLMFLAICGFCVGILTIPIVLIRRICNTFDDFKLKIPGSTQLYLDFYSMLDVLHGRYWIWLIPVLLPLWLVRLDRDVRIRIAAAMLLLTGAMVIAFVFAMWEPWLALIEGMTSK